MRKLTDFDAKHAYEHVQSGCWSMEMFDQWLKAVKDELYEATKDAAYTAGYDHAASGEPWVPAMGDLSFDARD